MTKYILIFLFPSLLLGAEDLFGLTKKLKQLEGKDYLSQSEDLSDQLEKLIDEKSKNCNMINTDRTECVAELKNMRLLFVKASFEARKNFLNYLHQKRMSALLEEETSLIKEIENNKKNQKRKKRR